MKFQDDADFDLKGEGEELMEGGKKKGVNPTIHKPSDNKKKKDRHQKAKELKDKDLNLHKYSGLTKYPKINDIYGGEYSGEDAAYCYSCYLSCCGKIPQALCFFCAPCRCGPLIEIPQGYIGIVMEFGKFVRKVGPGLHSFNSCTEEIKKVDIRTQSHRIPPQDLITRDNIALKIDCFVLFKVAIPEMAVFKLDNYNQYITYETMGTMKTVIAEKTLTEVLANQEEIEDTIRDKIDHDADKYGLHIQAMEIKKIELHSNMVTAMATIALTEKEMEAKIMNAKGDFESARIFREAADELSKNPVSLQLHYFETLKEISTEKSKMTLMPAPLIDFLM